MIRIPVSFRAFTALAVAAAIVASPTIYAQAADSNQPVQKIYDIGFLTHPQPDSPGASLAGARASGPIDAILEGADDPFFQPDDIVESIQTNIHEDSWSDNAHSISTDGTTLTVVNTAEVHEVIERYLSMLRAQRSRQVTVEATLLELPPAVLEAMDAAGGDAGGVLLSDAQRQILAAALERDAGGRVLQVARTTGFSGQRVHVRNARRRTYVHEYDVEIAEKSVVGDPITSEIEEGVLLDVRPMIEFGASRIRVEIRFEQQALTRALEAVDPGIQGIGRMHMPIVGRMTSFCTITVPPDASALAAIASVTPVSGERRCVALVVRAGILQPLAPPVKPVESAEKRQFRAFDLGFLAYGLEDFPGPSIDPTPLDGGVGPSAGFILTESVDAGLSVDIDQLVELIRRNVAPESWSNSRNRIWNTERQIMVVQTPEVLSAIEAYVASLARDRGRMVRVDMLVVERSGAAGGAGIGASPFESGGIVSAEAMKSLREEARKGAGLRILAEATAAGFHRQRVHISTVSSRNIISDLEVEVATDAKGYDPLIGRVLDGMVFDVRPALVGDGGGILLELRPSVARLQKDPELFATTPTEGEGNHLHLVDVDLYQPRLNLTVREGEWNVAALASDAGGNTHKALLVRARTTRVP